MKRILPAVHRRLTRTPGQRGTNKLRAPYGDPLVCVRYRYDPQRKKRYQTVERIVETVAWEPNRQIAHDSLVGLRSGLPEAEFRRRVKQAGGIWNRQRRVWGIRSDRVRELGLAARLVAAAGI